MLNKIVNSNIVQSLSPKQIDYILTWVGVLLEVLEGTTFSGKSFIQQIKFGLWVALSKYKFHVIACKTGSKAEEMIQDENGFLKIFPSAVYRRYGSREIRAPHIEFMGKIILLVGYGNSVEWEKVRGKNGIGMVLIDELNLCDPDFAKELIPLYIYIYFFAVCSCSVFYPESYFWRIHYEEQRTQRTGSPGTYHQQTQRRA